MLEINGLQKAFGANHVLKGIDLKVNKGDVVALLGPSGSGKTTLLRCISFLERADAGHMKLGELDVDLHKASQKEVHEARMDMGFVFQNFNLFNNKTVMENVLEPLVAVRKVPKEDALIQAQKVLEKVGMMQRADYYPDALSGGQQQRVAIARALVYSPDIVLFDEPTSALDPELTREVLEVMAQLAREGTTMLVVTHEMEFAKKVATSLVFMENGKIVESGSVEKMFQNPDCERTREFLTQDSDI